MSNWLTQKRPTENTVDVIPLEDLTDHQPKDDCICGPTNEFVEGKTSTGFICTHHSLDGREANE